MITSFNTFINEKFSYPNIWYHGSKFKFDNFKLKKGTLFNTDYIAPIFLTSNKEFASYYAGHKSPYIYTIQLLTNNIMDFRNLPTTYDILMFTNKKENKKNIEEKYFTIGNNILDFIFDKFPNDNIDKMYNDLLDADYSSVEQTWVYDWLKLNKYDGAYIIETKELNLLIFNQSKIKIISVG